MIRMIQSMSAANAKAYFDDSLIKAEYYTDKQELSGTFHGKLAQRLGLSHEVTKDDFYALCDNRHPTSGKQITPMTKEERTVSYDINFHAPKSVSIVEFLSGDDRITNAFHESVQKTMQEIEADSRVRVRKDKQDFDKPSGELAWATFIHKTARPVGSNVPDPHLHAHSLAFNMSYDKDERRYKACQFREIKRSMPYYQALYHKNFSDALMNLGYDITRTKSGFEISGIPKQAIDVFSSRRNQIERIAKEKGIVNPEELSKLGAKTRARKNKDYTMPELKLLWKQKIREHGYDKINPDAVIRKDRPILGRLISAEQSIKHGLDHNFSRASVVPTKRILQEALRHSIGSPNVTPDDLKGQFGKEDNIIRLDECAQTMCTTREVLKEERDMVELARRGIATMNPIYKECPALNLEGQQAEAVKHILTSSDQLNIIHGAAGAGKTTLMTEATHKMLQAGKNVFVVAPSSDASRDVLRSSGFHDAETVALFLKDKRLQDRIANGVLWVDEAGQLGTADTKKLLEITREQKARLILGGDYKQHSSVARGDAMRVLKKYGGIKPAEVSKIFRQEKKAYREAIQEISDGNIAAGFEKLDAIGGICQVNPKEPNKELVADYIKAVKSGKTTLVICPTHEHGQKVTSDIRQALKAERLISAEDKLVPKYDGLNLTDAEKVDRQNYQTGQWLRFSQNAKGIKRGSVWMVEKRGSGLIVLVGVNGKTAQLPFDMPSRFDVMHKNEIAIAKGDTIRITQNAYDLRDKRMNNGTMLEVTGFEKDGSIKLRNKTSGYKYAIPRDFGHISHGHCITSHAAQGKTVDEVFVAQPTSSLGAANAKQFYVSASRGRQAARFYTDDKDELLHSVSRLGDRQSAMEFVGDPGMQHNDYVAIDRRKEYDRSAAKVDKADRRMEKDKDRDHEPKL